MGQLELGAVVLIKAVWWDLRLADALVVCCVYVVSDFIILPGYVDFTANEVVSVFIPC